jgi:hypothetical protein
MNMNVFTVFPIFLLNNMTSWELQTNKSVFFSFSFIASYAETVDSSRLSYYDRE